MVQQLEWDRRTETFARRSALDLLDQCGKLTEPCPKDFADGTRNNERGGRLMVSRR